ncbi:uncharacterized protein A4U43_C05F29280 [Asparagus officinalis]|uniref:Uncharacterized protein n=1 Tax=Asparagus officinalis TaxID=4686 RepID=A0A5P1EZV4_ASPOF|nr:uncharacterized protein A4U43_C05F29280 [Asparagus officinalis]
MMARWQGVEELGSGLFEGGEGDGEEVDGVGSEGAASVRQRAARKAVGDERHGHVDFLSIAPIDPSRAQTSAVHLLETAARWPEIRHSLNQR